MSDDWDYYLHRSEGFIRDYFGRIGRPDKVSRGKYLWGKMNGYRVTRVPSRSPLRTVMIQALLNAGISLECYFAEKTLKDYEEKRSDEPNQT